MKLYQVTNKSGHVTLVAAKDMQVVYNVYGEVKAVECLHEKIMVCNPVVDESNTELLKDVYSFIHGGANLATLEERHKLEARLEGAIKISS